MSRLVIGFQIGDEHGRNIQGDDDDPSGRPSFVILDCLTVQNVLADAHPRRLTACPIFEGDIEEPTFEQAQR